MRKKDKYRNYTSYSSTSTNCVNGVCTSSQSNQAPDNTNQMGFAPSGLPTNQLALTLDKNHPNYYMAVGRYVGGTLGTIGGIVYSFQNSTGFWKGLGITLLASIVLGGAGQLIGFIVKKK